jgi:arsenate reductase
VTDRVYNMLFLCTGNSARSILAESIVNHRGGGRFRGFSAGSQPRGEVHPYALDLLRSLRMPLEGLRSKSWDEFVPAGAPEMNFIFTVCDNAAGEACPIWPGKPMTAHWGVSDPAAVEGNEITRRAAFRQAFAALDHRISIFLSLPMTSLDRLALQAKLHAIGLADPSASAA